MKGAHARRRLAAQLGLIGVSTGVVDSVDCIQDDPVRRVGVTLHRHDDAIVSELQQLGFSLRRTPRSQRFRASGYDQARIAEQPIKRKVRSAGGFGGQANCARDAGGDD